MKIKYAFLVGVTILMSACGGGHHGCCPALVIGSSWDMTQTHSGGLVLEHQMDFFADGTAKAGINNDIVWSQLDTNISWRKNIEDGFLLYEGVIGCDSVSGTFKWFDIAGPFMSDGVFELTR